MATAADLTGCITTHGIQTHKRLPASVKEAAAAGRADLSIAAMDAHIKSLKENRAYIEAQVKDFKESAINQSLPGTYINRQTTDPFNELNKFKTTGLSKALMNFVQRVGNIGLASKHSLMKGKVTKGEKAVIKHFLEEGGFNEKMTKAISEVFKLHWTRDERHRDMIQYLSIQVPSEYAKDRSRLVNPDQPFDTPTLNAMASVAYEWMATEGRKAMHQTDESLGMLFKLKKGEKLPAGAADLLLDTGMNADTIADRLGRSIVERLGIKAGPDADAVAQARFEKSIGFLAVAALEHAGYFERQLVIAGRTSDSTVPGLAGIEAIKDGQGPQLTVKDVILDPKAESVSLAGFNVLHLMKLVHETQTAIIYGEEHSEAIVPEYLQLMEETYKRGRNAFSKLFGTEPLARTVQWDKPKKGPMYVGDSKTEVVGEQLVNVQKANAIPYQRSAHAIDLVTAINEFVGKDSKLQEMFFTILGVDTSAHRLKLHKKSDEGIRRSVVNDLAAVFDFEDQYQERKKNQQSTSFYPQYDFMSQMRMLMRGAINPQNSKMHRAFFAPEGFTVTFKKEEGSDINTAFLEAVAVHWDIETGKKLIGSPEQQIAAMRDKAATPEVATAILALQQLQANEPMTANHLQAIADGVNAIGNKVSGFKGLLEYSRYMARDTGAEFTTDLHAENDGVTNGLIIATLQLIPKTADLQKVLNSLLMGGISTQQVQEDLNKLLIKHNLNDAYQAMGQLWSKHLDAIKSDMRASKHESDWELFDKAEALRTILGSFKEENGAVSKIVRSLAKPRTMQIVFGSGLDNQVKLFTGTSVIHDGIYKKVEDIIAALQTGIAPQMAKAETNFDEFMDQMRVLIPDLKAASYYRENGALSIKRLKGFKLEKAQYTAVAKATADTYGQAMENAVNEIYKPIMEARKPLNTVVQLAVTTHNTILKKKVDALLATRESGMITKAELKEITDSIAHLIPKIKTPQWTKNNPSYLPLAHTEISKGYSKETRVQQDYAKGTVKRLHGYAQGIPYLKAPGVAPMITTIHMLDSMVANGLMGLNVPILNNHDGFGHALTDSALISQEANAIFAQVMIEYSIGQAFTEMSAEMVKEGAIAMKAAGVTATDLVEGSARNPDSKKKTGGMLDDNLITFEVLEALGFVNRKERSEETKDATAHGIDWKVTHQKYFERALTKFSDVTNPAFKANVWKAMKLIHEAAKTMGEQTTANKELVTDAVHHWSNYPHRGEGYRIDNPPNSSGVINQDGKKIDATAVQESAEAAGNEGIAQGLNAIQQKLYSSGQSVSTNSADYVSGIQQQVDAQSVTETLESIVALDEQNPLLSGQMSSTHLAHLKGLLNNIVSRVMDPVQVYMAERAGINQSHGLFEAIEGGPNQIWIQNPSSIPTSGLLKHGLIMSAGEVYVHELVHSITWHGMNTNRHLANQVYALYEQAFAEFTKKYGDTAYRVFMNEPLGEDTPANRARWTTILNDPATAQERLAAQARWKYVFEAAMDPQDRNVGPKEFVTYGLTNENFKKALSGLTVSQEIINSRKNLFNLFEKNIQQTLENIFAWIMDAINKSFNQQMHSSRVDQQLENLVRSLAIKDHKGKSMVSKQLHAAETYLTGLGDIADEFVKKQVKKQWDKTKIGKAMQDFKKIPDLDNVISHKIRVALHWYHSGERGVIASLKTEAEGNTTRLTKLIDLLRIRKHTLDAAKNFAAITLRDVLGKFWEREDGTIRKLTKEEKTAFGKVLLKADVSYLLDHSSGPAIIGFVADATQREARITKLLGEIATDITLAPFEKFFMNASDTLGFFMINSQQPDKYRLSLMNAHNIASMRHDETGAILEGEAFDRAVVLIEQLTSLSALRYVQQSHRVVIAKLMRENWSAVEDTLNQHNALKADAFKDLFHGNPILMTKGYVKSIIDSRIKFEHGTIADRQRFEDAGYDMMATPLRRERGVDPVTEDIYMFKAPIGTANNLQTGVASVTKNEMRGTDSYAIQWQLGKGEDVGTPKVAADNNAAIVAVFQTKLKGMFKDLPPIKYTANPDNFLVPMFDVNGNVTNARYMMSEHVKDTILEQHNDYDSVMAAMAAQRIDKLVTPEVNKDLVLELKRMADEERHKFPEMYVEVSATSPVDNLREIWFRLPYKTKQHIYTEWGEPRMWVAQDVVDLAFGQRKYDVLEALDETKDRGLIEKSVGALASTFLQYANPFKRERPVGSLLNKSAKGRVVRRTKIIEESMIQLTKLAKSAIVVKTFNIIFGNHRSNIAYLKSLGIPVTTILTLQQESAVEAVAYQRTKQELDSLLVKRVSIANKQSVSAAAKEIPLRNLDRRVKQLHMDLANNKVKDLIDRGAMPSITDDVETGTIQSPHIFGLDAFIENTVSRLPKYLQTLVRQTFMMNDTETFKMMNNAVKLTDFTARYVLYHHKLSKGVEPGQALSEAMDQFINFDLPTHRAIAALNDLGLVWFSKYGIRVPKHIFGALKDKPATTLITYLISKAYLGNDNILNAIPGITKDVTQMFDDPLSTAVEATSGILTIAGVQAVGGILGSVLPGDE